jgi:lysozyme
MTLRLSEFINRLYYCITSDLRHFWGRVLSYDNGGCFTVLNINGHITEEVELQNLHDDIMRTTQNGIDIIKKWEGLRLESYLCPADVWTIGYGHTGKSINKGLKITEVEAEALLKLDLLKFETYLSNLPIKINQNQFDALISLVFNIGQGNFGKSTLLKKIMVNSNDPAIEQQFYRWNKAKVNGILTSLPGLTSRRTEEAELYFKTI